MATKGKSALASLNLPLSIDLKDEPGSIVDREGRSVIHVHWDSGGITSRRAHQLAVEIVDMVNRAAETENKSVTFEACGLCTVPSICRDRGTCSETPRNRRLDLTPGPLQFEEPTSTPMLLWCPGCGERHIDEGEFSTKPHHTHACQSCGMVWRPAIVATVGVRFLPGFKNDRFS